MERRGVSRLGTAEAPGVDWMECAALLTAALPTVHAQWASLAVLWMKTAEETWNVEQMESVAPLLMGALQPAPVMWGKAAVAKMTTAGETWNADQKESVAPTLAARHSAPVMWGNLAAAKMITAGEISNVAQMELALNSKVRLWFSTWALDFQKTVNSWKTTNVLQHPLLRIEIWTLFDV